MAQFARPDADQATGSWTQTPLWSKINEGSPGDDTTIQSDNNTSPDNADVRLSDVTDPQSASNHIIRAAWNKDSSGGHAINAVAELWQGIPGSGTQIAALSVTDIGAVEQVDTYTLTSIEADSITDYADLYLRISRQGDTGGNPAGRRSLVVDFAEFEVPDAAAVDPTKGRVGWTEFEVPLVETVGRISWSEIEVPLAPTVGRVSWTEIEAPIAPTRGRASWAEFEVPVISPDPTRGRLSQTEFEVPQQPTTGRISWAEFESPLALTRGRISWVEGEVPIAATRGRIAHTEFEIPVVATRGRFSFTEFQCPDVGAVTRKKRVFGLGIY